jgi:adenylate cyclase
MGVSRAVVLDLLRKHLAGIAAGILTVTLVHLGLLEPIEHLSLAQLFEIRGAREPTAPVVIVTIDESTFAELNEQWPFPRAMHGELLQTIGEGQPLVIGVDLLFDTPSRRGPQDDELLGAAVALAGNVVLGAAPKVDIQPGYRRVDANYPQPVIREGAAAVGPINLEQDADGHVRRAPLRVWVGEEAVLAFDAQLHQLAAKGGLPVAPLPKTGSILINFRGGPRTFPWVSYYRVLRREVSPQEFRGKIVLVGPTSEVLHDVFPTPFARGGNMPGVEIHANVIDTYVKGDPIREVPQLVSTILAVFAGLIGCGLVVRLRAFRALLTVLGLWVVLTGVAFLGFALADVWMRGMAGTLALLLGYGATVVEHFVREQREKRRLSQFFSPKVLREVVQHRDDGSLGTKRRLVTVLFSDIRGFTSLSEKLEPEQVAEMLREYLSEMTEVVFKHGGTVDKYIGDCIMALYNVPFADPEHAANAVRTALEFQERTLAVSAKWEARLGVSIRNGVGINTGEAVVGTMGSRQRLEYTAIGDTINLGSRLESITKDYKSSIIISESTHELVQGQFMTRELGEVTVKGKSQPVKIYAVLPASIRKHPRAILEAAATLTVAGTGETVALKTIDISEGGMALAGRVPEEWKKGATIQLRCEGGRLPKPIVAEATIAWRRDDAVGISFVALGAESAPTVAEYVAEHADGAVPATK